MRMSIKRNYACIYVRIYYLYVCVCELIDTTPEGSFASTKNGDLYFSHHRELIVACCMCVDVLGRD